MNSFDIFGTLLISLLVWAALGLGLYFAHRRLLAYYVNRPNQQFRRQLIMIGLMLFAILLGIIFAPITESLRGQLLSLYGIVISATIALSSTTLVGNAMAGIMLRTIRHFGPGDYVRVGEYFGRISEMDLLHTEIQTEERDLTTLPNLFMVTNPVRVLRGSGTILAVEVGLGYDVPRHRIEPLLIKAANETGLKSPFVQIKNLGDYSVTYAIAGLLTELNLMLQRRGELRARTMDVLHEAGIEIVSPAIMSLREYGPDKAMIPEGAQRKPQAASAKPDAIVFDKAVKAESLAKLKERVEEWQQRVKELETAIKSESDERAKEAAQSTHDELLRHIEQIQKQIVSREALIAKD